MRLINQPYRFRPRSLPRLQLADVILVAVLLAFATICLSGYKA
jgi:hypothetical protein